MSRTAIIAGLILGSYGFVAHADEKADLADSIYNYVMEKVPEYETLRESKVMTVCIEWDRPTPPSISIHQVFVTYEDPHTDIPVFINKLQQDALQKCERWASSKNANCTCQMLDKNGKNALRIP